MSDPVANAESGIQVLLNHNKNSLHAIANLFGALSSVLSLDPSLKSGIDTAVELLHSTADEIGTLGPVLGEVATAVSPTVGADVDKAVSLTDQAAAALQGTQTQPVPVS